MSVVIAVKDKDRFVLGADKQSSMGNTKDHQATKIWKVRGFPGAVMGSVGWARVSQLFQYADGILDRNLIAANGNIDEEFVVTVFTKIIMDILKSNDIKTVLDDSGCSSPISPNAFVLAYNDKCWVINQDLSVTEVDKYVAIGSGAEVARGALYVTPDQNPFKRVVGAIDAAAEETMYVDHEVEALATVEHKNDCRDYLTAVGYDEETIKQAIALQEGKLTIDADGNIVPPEEEEKPAKAKATKKKPAEKKPAAKKSVKKETNTKK